MLRQRVTLHSDVWEYNGFAVRYFSREDLRTLTGRFAVEEIFEFKEGALPLRDGPEERPRMKVPPGAAGKLRSTCGSP